MSTIRQTSKIVRIRRWVLGHSKHHSLQLLSDIVESYPAESGVRSGKLHLCRCHADDGTFLSTDAAIILAIWFPSTLELVGGFLSRYSVRRSSSEPCGNQSYLHGGVFWCLVAFNIRSPVSFGEQFTIQGKLMSTSTPAHVDASLRGNQKGFAFTTTCTTSTSYSVSTGF